MDRAPLDVSPVARFLIGLVEQRASGSVQLPERTLHLSQGELADISAAPSDPDFGEFTSRSGRIGQPELARARDQAIHGQISLERALIAQSKLTPADIRALRRSLFLDRLQRSLRLSLDREATLPTLSPISAAISGETTHSAAISGETTKFLPLVLDALARIALRSDAAAVGVRLNHRFLWTKLPLLADAKQWASLGETPDRPVVSALLARLPACAPQLAALLRAGFAELISPGRTATQNLSRTETLPPPPPRLSMLAEAPPRLTPRPDTSKPPRGSRGPRLQLDPGSAGVPIETIPLVERSVWPPAAEAPEDPLREIELALSERLYESSERVRAFVALSQLWQERIGSLEEATRALREAVAADPEDPALMEGAAQHCFRLGDGELAVRYASASAIATSEARERARRYELIALFERARGRLEPCLEALSEAAAEHPEEPGPHEAMAQLLADRDQLPLAAAHARMAASYYVVRNPERALRLHALAYVWHPTDPQLSSEYADALEWHGQPEAAVAVLAETARNLSGADRRDGLERAARRAELHNRRDLCSELLLEIFAEDPGYSAIHERLATSLDRVGLEAEHAAWLEAIAHHSAAADRPRALARAAEALARVDGEHEASLRHLWHAYRLDESILSSEQLARFAAISGELKSGPPDPIATAQTLEAKLTAADSGEHVALLARLAALHAERGDARGLASACLRLLSIEPTHAMATARLARAALELTDPVLRREALITLGRIRTGREQGRALALLARQLENMADFDSAVTTAEAALGQDHSAADAAIIALRHAHRLAPRRALALLARARTLLAAPPILLLSMAEAAAAAGDSAVQRETLRELSTDLPFLLQPRLRSLATSIDESDVDAIVQHSDALLEHCAGAEANELARQAVARLVELDDHAAAARLAERVLSWHGQFDPAYADYAYKVARRTEDPALCATALERCASVHDGAARRDYLLRLADLHRAQGDTIAEIRALLRALPLPDEQGRALARLAQRFAEQGDSRRLLAVLTLRLDATHDPDARRTQLFEMASAAVSYAADPDAVIESMSALFQESATDRAWLLFALGGLFALGDAGWATATACNLARALPPDVAGVVYLWLAHRAELEPESYELALHLAADGARRFGDVGELLLLAERLTLAAHDKRRALWLYGELLAAAMGPHGRRALHYRAGRWLERAGEPSEALVHYQQAFTLAPGAGVAFHALERAARAAKQLDILVDAQQLLARSIQDERARADLLEAAALSCLHDLDQPARAVPILLDAEACLPTARLDSCLSAAFAALTEIDPAAASGAVNRVIETRLARAAPLWPSEQKTELMLSAARLHLDLRRDSASALALFDAVLNSDLRASVPEAQLAGGLIDYARALTTASRAADAELALADARALSPDLVSARALRDPPANTQAIVDEASFAPSMPDESTLRERADRGDRDALAALVDRLRGDRARREEAHALLGQLVRVAPGRIDALRLLHIDAIELGAHAEARVCAQIIAMFDPMIEAPARIPFEPADLPSDELADIVHSGENPELAQLLHLLFEHGRNIGSLRPPPEVADGEPIAANDRTALGRAFDRACKLLGRSEVSLYLQPQAAEPVVVVVDHPARIVLRSAAMDPLALEFLLARALVISEPRHAALCALPEPQGRALVTALLTAFDQRPNEQAITPKEKDLASELSRGLSSRIQTQMRLLLESSAKELDYDVLRSQAELCALRAGLIVASDPAVALATFAQHDAVLAHCDVRSEAGFAEACQRSEGFREIIRTALSLPYVGLTALAIETAA